LSNNIYGKYKPLECEVCGRDVFGNPTGIIVIFQDIHSDKIHHVIPSCKGGCDKKIVSKYSTPKLIDGWREISDFKNPLIFAKRNMEISNNLQVGNFTPNAWEGYKKVVLVSYQYVLREPTSNDWQQSSIENLF